MRHQNLGRRLGRTTEHRTALLGNLVTALIHHESIETTLPKAKEARRLAEKMITLAKRNAVHHRRLAARTIRDGEALGKLFGTLGPRFASRQGGYTRIVRLGHRLGDAAPMALLEWTEREKKVAAEPAGKGGKAAAKGASSGSEEKKAKATTKPEAKKEPAKKAESKKAKAPEGEGKTAKAETKTAKASAAKAKKK